MLWPHLATDANRFCVYAVGLCFSKHSSVGREPSFGRAPLLKASASGVAEVSLWLLEGSIFVLPPFSFISPLVLPVPLANSLEFLKVLAETAGVERGNEREEVRNISFTLCFAKLYE